MDVSTKQRQIADVARRTPQVSFTSLNHHLDAEWFEEAFRRIKKDGAPGCDGITAKEYERELGDRLPDLLGRAKTGSYFAPPVKRVYIPKGDGRELRPIGIPTVEDKVLQRAMVMLLEPIYECDFLPCSYGFRPGRSAHQAVARVRSAAMAMGGGWVLDVDIRKFFDTLDHGSLRGFLQRRVRDGVVRRLIDKWLKAGVLDGRALSYPKSGTPQGGVISPLLSNIYLHYVLDEWFEVVVSQTLQGRAELIRFADDAVLIFEREVEARRVWKALEKRLGRYGLRLHPEKTKLVRFESPRRGGGGRPGTFNFLGFTFYWGRTLKGGWAVKTKTAADRHKKAVRAIHQWCKRNRHLKFREQHSHLSNMVRGHYNYFGLPGNYRELNVFIHRVQRVWRYWLNRRDRTRSMPWKRFSRILDRQSLPRPRIVHSFS